MADAIREAQKNPGTVVLNFMTDTEQDVYPMIPGGKTIHEMVLDESGPVGVPDADGSVTLPNGNGQQTEVEVPYVSEWTDDLQAGKRKI